MRVIVGAFNQEKALVWAFFVIEKPTVKPMDTALVCTHTLSLAIHHNYILVVRACEQRPAPAVVMSTY